MYSFINFHILNMQRPNLPPFAAGPEPSSLTYPSYCHVDPASAIAITYTSCPGLVPGPSSLGIPSQLQILVQTTFIHSPATAMEEVARTTTRSVVVRGDTFTVFPKLPAELRLKIFKLRWVYTGPRRDSLFTRSILLWLLLPFARERQYWSRNSFFSNEMDRKRADSRIYTVFPPIVSLQSQTRESKSTSCPAARNFR